MSWFRFLFVVVWPLAHLYLAWRTASVPAVARRVSRRVVAAVAAVLCVSAYASRWAEDAAPRLPATLLEASWCPGARGPGGPGCGCGSGRTSCGSSCGPSMDRGCL